MRLMILALVWAGLLNGQDAQEIFPALERGRQIDAAEAAQLEKAVAQSPKRVLDRLSLISFYTNSEAIDVEAAVAGRRQHLLWLAQEQPESKIWESMSYQGAVYPNGGRLPDPEGFAAIRDVWLAHLEAKPKSKLLIERVAGTLEIGDRERAVEYIERRNSPGDLGSFHAEVLLGVTARDFRSGIAVDSDGRVRQTALWQESLALLESSDNPEMVGAAAATLTRDGAALWANGFTEWDYSPLAKLLTERIQRLEPYTLRWYLLNTELPNPGESRPMLLGVGGSIMSAKLIKQVTPEVPPLSRGLKGTVSLDVAVGEDGHVFKVLHTGGPPQLLDACATAVAQWIYKPTLLLGKPVIVLTQVNCVFQ